MGRFTGATAVVTGGAGFIGSHLVAALVADGASVRVVDCFTPYYDVAIKRGRVARFPDGVDLSEVDLASDPLEPHLDGATHVFHLAGQPGVRASWGAGFADYVDWNIIATQRLLEACVGLDLDLRKFVNSSSSSVYGAAETFPTSESSVPRPVSPYGVTKLAAENLCGAYAINLGLPVVSLRYFTVYGPGQRPDMATQRLCRAAILGERFTLNGDGTQIRDFTYVGDVVEANLLAALGDVADGSPLNIGGGAGVSMNELIGMIESISGNRIDLEHVGRALGDPMRTGADRSAAERRLGWVPAATLEDGLAAQIAAVREAAV